MGPDAEEKAHSKRGLRGPHVHPVLGVAARPDVLRPEDGRRAHEQLQHLLLAPPEQVPRLQVAQRPTPALQVLVTLPRPEVRGRKAHVLDGLALCPRTSETGSGVPKDRNLGV